MHKVVADEIFTASTGFDENLGVVEHSGYYFFGYTF